MLNITVAYATLEKQVEIPLSIEPSCTVAVAIKRSGILQHFPQIEFSQIVVGVYGKRVALDSLIKQNDRIEIYRQLLIDPKQARRQRAKSGQ